MCGLILFRMLLLRRTLFLLLFCIFYFNENFGEPSAKRNIQKSGEIGVCFKTKILKQMYGNSTCDRLSGNKGIGILLLR